MKIFTAHFSKGIFRSAFAFAVIILLTLINLESYAQTRIYANTVSASSGTATSLTGCGLLGLGPCSVTTVDNAANAITNDENSFATVKSSGGVALNLLAYSGELEIKFPSNVQANTTTFVRIDFDPDILNALLGGNLGNLLANVVGNVALGNHSFEVGARNASGATILSGNSTGQFASNNLRLIKDAFGRFYVAITPNQPYDRVYVKDITSALLLGTTNNTKVYYAFHSSGSDPCAQAFATGFEGTGITLDALKLGNSGVINSERAIDADPNNFSQISLGVLAVGGTASQNFYFDSPSNAGDDFNLNFKSSPALLTAGLLNGITVEAFNGSSSVFTQTLSPGLLNLDLLTLLNNGSVVSVPFSPGVAFDRVKVTLSSLVNLNLTQNIDVYGVTRSAGRPTFTSPATNTVAACYNVPSVLRATTPNTNELIWYDAVQGGTPLATVAFNGTFTTPPLAANKTYYVAARRLNCTVESARVPVLVTVNPLISFASTTLSNATSGFNYNKSIDPATGGTPGFTYALASASTLPTGLTLSSTGEITGTPTLAGNYNFSVVATDTKGCTATAAYTLTVTGALTLAPGNLPNGITGVVYPTQTIPAAAGGTGPYTYAAVNVPAGLTFDPVTREIKGTPTTPGNSTVIVTVTDANGNSVAANYTIKITDPFVLPPATLANGTTNTAYQTQFIPAATGGSTPYTYAATNLPPGLAFNTSTRAVTGTPTLAGTYVIPVTATDADLKTITTNYSITVTDPLLLPSAILPDGTENLLYATQTIPSATGGVGPYSYVAANVPAGLSFDANSRQITGTPAQAGNYSITITATDSEGRIVSNNYSLKVNGTVNLPTATLPNGTVGSTYSPQTLPAASGGTGTYTYVASNLPPGLTFNPTTRTITGTPTTGGTFGVSVTATDGANNKATTVYNITVNVNAPIVALTTVCSGSVATLSVSNAQAGVSYRLYGPTGSTPIQTNASGTFTTPAVNSQTTFYVEAVSGTAVSTKTAVTVSINPPATLATITTSNQVINVNQSATLTATADAGNTISWYDAAIGGNLLQTGGTYITPQLSATTTYYVQTTTAAGCASSSRVMVTVTVITGTGGASCNAANVQNTGINGICLLCGITGAGNSTDANPNNFTRISLTVGAGATGYQQLIFPSAGVATDSIRLDLGLPIGLADVGVLNNITVTVLNGSTIVRTVQINGALLNLSLLGGSRFTSTLLAGGTYDRVQVSFAATVSALSSLDIYGATIVYPNPTLTAGAQSICAGSSATLSAQANGGTTIKWFDAPVGGNQVGTNANFTTPNLTATTTYYIEVSKLVNNQNCPNPNRVPVTVTVNPAIVFNNATLTSPSISFPYSQQLPAATGGTPGFTYALANGSTLPAGLNLSGTGLISGTPTAAGNPTISVVVTDTKNCTATATFNLGVTPALSLAGAALPDGVTGTSYPTQTIPAAAGGTGPYNYAATGLPPGLSFNTTTREITGIPTQKGNYTIPVTVTDANGNTITANYTLKVVDPLVLPPATLADGTTNAVYPTQTIPAATGGTLPYTYAATGLPSGLSFNPATREITGTPSQSGTFPVPVTVTDAEGRTATTTYSINVVDPLTLPPATLADGNENVVYPVQTLPAAIGGVGPYTYVATNLPAGLNFDVNTRQITGTPTQAGNYVISVTATDSQNRTASNTYALKVIGTLNLPTATLPNGVVGTSYPVQTLPAVTGGTGPYTYLASNLPPGLSFNTTTREITGTPTQGGSYIISLTATDAAGNTATTGYSLTVTVNAPVVANAAVCSGSTATLTVGNTLPGVTYNWYPATGNTPLVSNNNGTFTTPALTTQTVFYVEAVSGTAVSSRTAVTVSINPPATLATVTTNNQVINAGQSTTLLATADAGNIITWFDAAAGGNQVGTGTSFTTPVLTTNTTYYVETRNASGCVSASRVPVTVTVIPTGSGTACNAANSQNSGITGICLLCGITGAGNSTDADLNNYTRITLAVGVGSTGYQQLIFPSSANGTAADSVHLDLALPGGLLDLQVLNNITVNILNGTTVVRTVQLSSSLVNLQLLSGNRFAATLAAGAPFDRVEVRFGGLVSAVTSLDVYGATITYPSPTITAGAQTICSGATATLAATANGGTNIKWFSDAAGGTALASGETFTTPALTATTTYYIQVYKGTCPNTNRIPVTITVTPALTTPVVAAVTAGCAGSPATLSVTNPVTGVIYNWYDAPNGGNLVLTGPVVTTPALAANTTYYVEASQGNCVSATRATVVVPVNPRPVLPVVTASSSSVSPGQTAILTATSSESNVVFNWFNSATSTTPIYVGGTYVTQPLTATTTYYVETVSANGCSSASRVQITISVNGGGSPNPVPCEAAIAQTNGVIGLGVLANVFNPGLAIDNDTQTASSLVLPVGALGGAVYQRVGFGSVSNLGDTVRVLVSSPGKLLSLSLLGNSQITTYLGANSNGDSRTLNSGLLNVQLLSGDTQALITFVPTATFDGVEVRLNGGVLAALTSLNFNYAQRIVVAPTVVSSNVTACVGQTTQLTVNNPSTSLTYRWYDAAGNYLAGKDGIIFTTPVLTANTRFFVAAVTASGCVSYRTAVNVTTNPAPVTPELLSPDVNTCANTSVVFQVKNPDANTTYKWYDAANVYQAGFDGPTFTVANVTANSTYTVEAVNGCGSASARATATINVGSIDAPVVTPSSATITQGSVASLIATSTTSGVTINWYTTINGTLPVYSTVGATSSNYITPPLSSNTSYYVEATIPGGCTSPTRTKVDITVIPNGTPVPTPCGAAVGQTSGTAGLGIGAAVLNPGQAIDSDINSGSSLVIPVGLLNSSVFQKLTFPGLSNVGDTLRVKITTPGQLLSLALLQNTTLTTYQGAVSNGDVTSISNPLITLNLLSGQNSAILTFIPTNRFDGVELRLTSGLLGALTSINFDYAQRTIVAPTLTTASLNTCQGSSATLSVQNPQPNVTYKWYLGGDYQTGKDGVTFSTEPSLAAGIYDYFVTANANGCETIKVKATVTVLAPPTPPVASPTNPATTCLNSSVELSVVAVAGNTYNWYSAAINGNLLASNSDKFSTPANLPVGTFDYYVEAVSASNCSNTTRTKVSITVNPNALAGDITVSGNTGLCASGNTTLTASSTINNAIFTWYSDAALTQVVSNAAIFQTPAITTTTRYYVTVRGDGKCANTPGNAKEVTITLNPIAAAADVILTGPASLCGSASVTLNAQSTTVVNPIFTWYSDAALTNIVNTTAQFTTPTLTATTTYYVTVKGDNKCENTAATAKPVTITVNPYAVDADINLSGITSICKGESTILSGSSATVTNPVFTWYSEAALTNVVYTGASFNTGTLSANTTYYVTIKGDNKCENQPNTGKAITVIVKEYATAADITVANTQICSGSSTMLMASSLTVTQPVFTWYNDQSLTSVAFVGPTFTINNLTSTTTYYVTVKGTNKCENSAADAKAVVVTVNPLATTTDIIVNGGTTACGGSGTTLTATSPTVNNPVFTWYSDAALTNITFIGSSFNTPPLNVTTTYYVTVKGDNKCENAPGTGKAITITITPVANSNDVSANDASICSGSSASLVATTTMVTNPVYTWYSDAALTSVAFTGATFNTPALTATTRYYLTIKGDNRCESSAANAKVVTVTVNDVATAADITVNNPAVICGSGSATLNASSTTVTSPVFTWYSDASLTSVAFVGPIFNTPALTGTTTYYVTVKGSNKCENTSANAKAVTVTVNPRAVASDIVASGTTSVCTNASTILTASSTTVTNPVFTWYNDAALTSVASVGATFTTPVLTANTTYYVTVRGSNKCENAAGSAQAVAITVNAIPNNPVVATAGTNICAGDPTVLSITNAQTGVTYEWYSAATNGNLLFTGTAYTTPALTTNTDYYIQAIGAGGCNNNGGRVKITVTVNSKPNVPTVTSANVNVCTGSTAVLTVSNPQANVVYNWYTSPANGTLAGTGTSFTIPAVANNVTYYVEGANGSCISASRTPVNVNALPVPVAPLSVTAANGTICAGSNTILTVNNPVAGLIYRWYTTSSNGTSIGEGITFTTPNISATTIFYVESIALGGCASPTRTGVTVTVLPVLTAPAVVVQSTTVSSVTFAWAAVNNATGYEVSTDNGLTWQASVGTSYTAAGLKPDQAVTIVVRAKGQLDCQTSANSRPETGKATNPLGNQVYIPNAFTPNNDGKNDVFMIYGNTIASAKMAIYTQWGQLIYQSDNVATGWDGTYKGVNQPIGVYVYMVEVQFTDGTNTMKKGTVTLLR